MEKAKRNSNKRLTPLHIIQELDEEPLEVVNLGVIASNLSDKIDSEIDRNSQNNSN